MALRDKFASNPRGSNGMKPGLVEVGGELDPGDDETDWGVHPENSWDSDLWINRVIPEYPTSSGDLKVLGDFDLARELVEGLKWYHRLRIDGLIPEEWKGVRLDLPGHVRLTFEIRDPRELGFYKYARSSRDGTRWSINLNPRSVMVFGRSPAQTASVFCHELLHLCENDYWQKIGKGARSPGYHSTEFRRRAGLIGIPCTDYGAERGIKSGSPFDNWLGRHGVPRFFQYTVERIQPATLAKRLAWRCGCENSVSVMVPRASRVKLVCQDCSQLLWPVNPDDKRRR
jgi:hypothetical protein